MLCSTHYECFFHFQFWSDCNFNRSALVSLLCIWSVRALVANWGPVDRFTAILLNHFAVMLTSPYASRGKKVDAPAKLLMKNFKLGEHFSDLKKPTPMHAHKWTDQVKAICKRRFIRLLCGRAVCSFFTECVCRQKQRHQSLNVRFADGLSDFGKRWIEGMRFGHLFPLQTYRSRSIFLHKSNGYPKRNRWRYIIFAPRTWNVYWPISFREKVDLFHYRSTRCI